MSTFNSLNDSSVIPKILDLSEILGLEFFKYA
jgi:hypothetical protein